MRFREYLGSVLIIVNVIAVTAGASPSSHSENPISGTYCASHVAPVFLRPTTHATSLSSAPTPPDISSVPVTPAPKQLAHVILPDDLGKVIALFGQLPREIAGKRQSVRFKSESSARFQIGFADTHLPVDTLVPLLSIQALDITKGDFFPKDWAGGEVVAMISQRGPNVIEAGRDGKLLWAHQESYISHTNSEKRIPIQTLIWGSIDSPWLFTIQADTAENLGAVLEVFIATAKLRKI